MSAIETIGWDNGPRRAALETFMLITRITQDLDDARRFLAPGGNGNLLDDDIADAEAALLIAAQDVVNTR